MPRFELVEEPVGESESESEDEPPHPLGFGVVDPSSPWGKTWISLDPPSRSKYFHSRYGRSKYGLDEEEDLFVQSFPPLSAYLSSKHVPTSTLLEFGNGEPVRSRQWQQPYHKRTRMDTDDDLYYSSADDDDNDYDNNGDGTHEHDYREQNYTVVDENNDVELLFQHSYKPSNIPLLTGLQLQKELSLLASPKEIRAKRDETNRKIQRRVETERRRIDEEYERTAAILGELVLQSNQEAKVILQREKAEEEKIARARSAKEENERKLKEKAEKEAALRKEQADKETLEQQKAEQKQREERQARETIATKKRHEAEARAKMKTEHIDKAKKLVGQLVLVRTSVEPFEKNKAVGKRRLAMKKIAKGKVNTLNDNPEKIREVATEISRAITLYDQEDAKTKQQLKQKVPDLTPDMALGRRYFVDLLASTAMMRVQAESFCGTKGDGFQLAAMLAMVAVEHKNILAVLAAHIYTVCPTAIPVLPSPGPDASEDELMTALGMQRDKKTGDFESFPQFLSRTENIISFMAAIQSSLPSSHQLLGGNTGAILWLKRFLDLLPPAPVAPLPLTTAPVLGAFLIGAGHMLVKIHPDRFRKLLGMIESDVLHRLDEGEVGKPSAIRLAKVLEGGFDAFKKNLPPKAIPDLYYGASEDSKKTEEVTSFGGTIGGEESVKPKRDLAPPPSNPFGEDSGAFGRSSYSSNNDIARSSPSPFGSSVGNPNAFGSNSIPSQSPFGGGSQTPTTTPFGAPVSQGFGQAPSPSPFGSGVTAPSVSPFGGTVAQTQSSQAPQPSPFGSFASSSNTAVKPTPFGTGGMAPAPSPFGNTTAPSPFGGIVAAPSPSPFGQTTSISSPPPFGVTTAVQSPSPFGDVASSSQSPFGATMNGANPSPFGGSNAMQQNSPFGGGGNNHQNTTHGGGRKKGPCKYYAQGRCRNGANCPYSHESGGGGGFGNQGNAMFGSNSNNSGRNNQGFGSNNSNNRGGNKKEPCRFYAQGRCKKGKNCQFSHDFGAGGFGGGNNNNNQGFTSNNWNTFSKSRR